MGKGIAAFSGPKCTFGTVGAAPHGGENGGYVRGRFGPGADFAGDFGAYFGAPSTVGRGSEPGTDCPTYRRYRREGGRNGPRLYPSIFATVETGG